MIMASFTFDNISNDGRDKSIIAIATHRTKIFFAFLMKHVCAGLICILNCVFETRMAVWEGTKYQLNVLLRLDKYMALVFWCFPHSAKMTRTSRHLQFLFRHI